MRFEVVLHAYTGDGMAMLSKGLVTHLLRTISLLKTTSSSPHSNLPIVHLLDNVVLL